MALLQVNFISKSLFRAVPMNVILPVDKMSTAKVVGCKKHHDWAKECADQSITLVKEEKGVLPITPERYPRIMVYPIEKDQGNASYGPKGGCGDFIRSLEAQGFSVSV